MEALFSPDSKFMQAMSRIADLILLNVIFLLSCVPIVTIGAAVTGLCTVCFRMGTPREHGVITSYFRAFRDNWKQATALWLLLLFLGCTACLNIRIFSRMPGVISYAAALFALLFVLVLLIAAWVFPLLSQFDNSISAMLKNAVFLSLGHLPRSILLVLIQVFPFALLILQPYLFFYTGFIWVLIYFSAAAYICSFLLKKALAPYLPNEEESA